MIDFWSISIDFSLIIIPSGWLRCFVNERNLIVNGRFPFERKRPHSDLSRCNSDRWFTTVFSPYFLPYCHCILIIYGPYFYKNTAVHAPYYSTRVWDKSSCTMNFFRNSLSIYKCCTSIVSFSKRRKILDRTTEITSTVVNKRTQENHLVFWIIVVF